MELTALLSQRERINTFDVGSEPMATFPHGVCHDKNRIIPEWIVRSLEEKSFKPHVLFSNGHAQTILAYAWPRYPTLSISDPHQERLFEVEPNVRLLAHCHWQPDPVIHPTLLLVHGLEGSSSAKYMLGTTEKAFRAGFNVIRLNLRNCGGTEHLTPTLYHSGMTGDLRAVIKELVEIDHLRSIFLIGFSMGGNMVLKLAGEDGNAMASEISGFCAVSPAIDLSSCAEACKYRSNRVYEQFFLRSLCRRLRIKRELFPDLYDTSDLHLVRTIRDFDERYTAHDGGFTDADDYYKRASALPVVDHIHRPTLIIHAQDDPFIPFAPFNHSSLVDNPYVLRLAPEHGGHVGFIADHVNEQDRFWAENRIVEFCQLIHESAEF
jgi:predicted alpha/beta-fold hydrolase